MKRVRTTLAAIRGGLLCAGTLLLAAAPALAQGVHVALTPAAQSVATGAQFDLDVTCTQAGSAFNGFKAVITYDPAALTFLPRSPTSLQQGSLMTGACGNSPFHSFVAAGDSMVVTDILLCDQTVLTGPGQLYKLRFQASNTQQITHVNFRSIVFYNGGVFVNPVFSANATIGIGTPLDAGDPPPMATGVRLRPERNPARGMAVFSIEAGEAGEQEIAVFDVSGRRVRTLSSGWFGAGSRRVTWDGNDAAGERMPAGIYLATLKQGDRTARARFALIR